MFGRLDTRETQLLNGYNMKCPCCNQEEKKRTTRQSNAIHLYFRLVSDELNNQGVDMRDFFSSSFELRWTPENVKEFIWRKIQVALYNKKSTTQLKTNEVDKVYEVMSKVIAEKAQISIPFPSFNSIDNEENK